MRARLIGVVGAGAFAAAAAGQHGPAPTWQVEFGSSQVDWASALAADGAGGVFVGGDTAGDLGGPSAGQEDAYVARYDADGNRQWLTQIGTDRLDWVRGLAGDGAGGVFITGRTFGSFVGRPRIDDSDAWLGRVSDAGEVLWAQEFGGPGRDYGWALTPDGAGGVLAAGAAESALDGGGSGFGAFVTRYDGEGQRCWVNQFGVDRGDSANAIASDGADGAFVAGNTYGDLGAPSSGQEDAFLARMSAGGELLWVRQFGTAGRDQAHGVASDGAGGVFVAGTGGSLAAPSTGPVFVARYDGNGNRLWIIQFGARSSDRITAATSDGAGGVLVTGSTVGDLGGALAGFRDVFIARIDASGNVLWISQLGATEIRSTIAGAALDSAGGLFAAGGHFPLNPGDGDAWLARFPLDAGCYADCDTSGELDLFDLLCFQDLFAARAPRADCDLSGELDFFDFVCFQNEFAARCP